MNRIKFIVLFLSVFYLMFSCYSDDPVECITGLDCGEGYVCEDGWCVWSGEHLDDSSGYGEPDEKQEEPDTPSKKTDDIEYGYDTAEEDQFPDDDFDWEYSDEFSDETVETIDEDFDDEDYDEDPDEEPDEEPDDGPIIRTDQPCTGLPSNGEWNTVSSITQVWDGFDWVPSTEGFYSETGSTTECRFKCMTNYTWNAGNSTCDANVRYDQSCMGLPSNASWNTVSSITQTWSGTTWLPTTTGVHNETPSETECRYKCNPDYHWGGASCISNTKIFTCSAKPANTDWNTVSGYTQNWNGSVWVPADSTTHYNESTTTTACHFKCSDGHHWNGSECISSTRTFDCTAKPANTDWNTVSGYTQNWDGSNWVPANSNTHYNETPSETACHFKCSDGHHWNGSECISSTRTFDCTAKPANTDWNIVSSYTQNWDGSNWVPADSTTHYNESATTTACHFKCSDGHHWNGSACVECTGNQHCSDPKPHCKTDPGICVECLIDDDCDGDLICNSSNQCVVDCTVETWSFSNTSTGRTGTIQSWTVPSTGTYRITAYGAQGAGTQGGRGAKMSGEFELEQGTVINILVGQRGSSYFLDMGESPDRYADGGGGGSFVVRQGGNTVGDIYVIAGGGGGSRSTAHNNRHAVTTTSGNDGVGGEYDFDPDYLKGGTDGSGGNRSRMSAGGGGFSGNGVDAQYADGGFAYLNGGEGGSAHNVGHGGFGGGGGAHTQGGGSWGSSRGGGGGYSGGGGGHTVGGGGGSYNNGANQDNAGGNRSGHGLVEITRVCE